MNANNVFVYEGESYAGSATKSIQANYGGGGGGKVSTNTYFGGGGGGGGHFSSGKHSHSSS